MCDCKTRDIHGVEVDPSPVMIRLANAAEKTAQPFALTDGTEVMGVHLPRLDKPALLPRINPMDIRPAYRVHFCA